MFRDDPEYMQDFSLSTREKKDLDPETIHEVESIPGWYWDSWDGFVRVYLRCIEEGIEIKDNTVVDFDFKELRNIGAWVRKMRGRALRGELKTHQIAKIESLPGWTYEPQHDKFMEGIKRFAEYTSGRENKNVTQTTVLEDGYRLGAWVCTVRIKKRKGDLSRNTLYASLYENLLNHHGFMWEGPSGNQWTG